MLYTKKSQIPKAGKGLYTSELIKKGTHLIEYKGEEITWDEVVKRSEKGYGGYVFYVTKKKCIDAYFTPKHMARYANDARGPGRALGLKNNSVFAIKNKKGYIQANRNIKPNEEIFVWYGADYWKEHLAEQETIRKRKRSEAAKKAWHIRKAAKKHPVKTTTSKKSAKKTVKKRR
jgi:SET domain-containing protein